MNTENFTTAVLYTCATCNLNCKYCNIDKNPALLQIDNELEKSFQDENYYLNRIQKYFPRPEQLHRIEFWGGEPLTHISRVFLLIDQLVNNYPQFNEIFSSTNFSYPDWNNQLFSLFNQLGKYNREFRYELQLSCDGPEYINDSGRGKGTTQKCLENFDIFIEKLKNQELPKNISLDIMFKPTLDIVNLKKLDTKEKIIQYYQFFEEAFTDKVYKLNNNKISVNDPLPNTAEPMMATQEDGKFFAKFTKMCKEINYENSKKHYFKYYDNIVMFSQSLYDHKVCPNYRACGRMCGIGHTIMGFLPNNFISTCHEGFTDLVDEYKKRNRNPEENKTIEFNKVILESGMKFCISDEQFDKMQLHLDNLYVEDTTVQLTNWVSSIITFAMAGLIDQKYLNMKEAYFAANFLNNNTVNCIKNNYNITGTSTLVPVGDIKLFLNGALDEIIPQRSRDSL